MYYNIYYINDDGDYLIILNQAATEEAVRANFAQRNPGFEIVDVWARPDFVPVKSNIRPSKPRVPKNLYDRLRAEGGNCAACGVTRAKCRNRHCSDNPRYASRNKKPKRKGAVLREFSRLGL